jgi:hypothetical protein
MVTEVQDTDVNRYLAWDAFLKEGGAYPNHIATFRRVEWPNIVRLLKKEYGIIIEDDSEPHWVAPGKAVYWQEQIESRVSQDAQGNRERTWEPTGWKPTSFLPANNASVIAYYLRKGLRFRPPLEGVGVEEALQVAAVPSEALQSLAIEEEKTEYACNRHNNGTIRFGSWKAYIRHCVNKIETIEYDLPMEVAEIAKGFQWYCSVHNQGFNNERNVKLHIRSELRRPGRAIHLTVEQMRQGEENSIV